MRTKRKSLIEERYYKIKRANMSFISMVEERVATLQYSLVPYFPNDLMFRIFLLLPIKSLLRVTCVCKTWYKLINCAEFVEAYNSQAQTTPILLRCVNHERPNIFHVETELNQSENFSIFPFSSSGSSSKFIHFLEIEESKGRITDSNISSSGPVVAASNGLILIISLYRPYWTMSSRRRPRLDWPLIGNDSKAGRLIVMNPMTRKFIGLPLGTLPCTLANHVHESINNESYGLVFSHSKKAYKVVHLFKDKLGFIACEILSLQARSWKAVDGPSEGLLRQFGRAPVSAIGALHWIPEYSPSDYIVSMGADDEKFTVTELPKTLGIHDRLIEMGGFLSFVTSLDMGHIEVWILKGLGRVEWVKQHSIHIDAILGHVDIQEFSVPAFALNAKEMVFRRRKQLYSYDFEHEEIREIEMEGATITTQESFLPHSNNLATWEPLEPMS